MADKRRATYQDLLSVPDTKVAEIVHGLLITSPRPAGPHTLATAALMVQLGRPLMFGEEGPGGWWIVVEPELHLGSDILVPDLAGWRRERMQDYPLGPFVELAPDWVCEILSPSSQRLDRAEKIPIYAREGVMHAWLMDPEAKTLEVLRLEQGKWVLTSSHAGDEEVRAEPFHARLLRLRSIWRPGD
jgi:Uma2 family endonuclease